MDNDQMEGLLEGMGMEGMEGMEAMEAAMENDDPKQSDGPNINTSQTKELPAEVKEIQVDFSQDKSKFFILSSISFQFIFYCVHFLHISTLIQTRCNPFLFLYIYSIELIINFDLILKITQIYLFLFNSKNSKFVFMIQRSYKIY